MASESPRPAERETKISRSSIRCTFLIRHTRSLAFTLQAGDQNISLEGVVRHSVDQEGMGIQFTKVSAESKRRLRIHIGSLAPATSQSVKT